MRRDGKYRVNCSKRSGVMIVLAVRPCDSETRDVMASSRCQRLSVSSPFSALSGNAVKDSRRIIGLEASVRRKTRNAIERNELRYSVDSQKSYLPALHLPDKEPHRQEY